MSTKQPYKLILIPLDKFKNEAIPHHQRLFKEHETSIQKLKQLGNIALLERETKSKKRIVRQLKDLMYELDALRMKVQEVDLTKFDSETGSLISSIIFLINGYTTLEAEVAKMVFYQDELQKAAAENALEDVTQLQMHASIDELKLRDDERRLNQMENLTDDIETVREIFFDLNQMVAFQQEPVDNIETNVEAARDNVRSGLKYLINAERLKKSSYPLTGAVIGSVIAGPVGLIAGLKVGGIAAVTLGAAGYFGGRLAKKSALQGGVETINALENAEQVPKEISSKGG